MLTVNGLICKLNRPLNHNYFDQQQKTWQNNRLDAAASATTMAMATTAFT